MENLVMVALYVIPAIVNSLALKFLTYKGEKISKYAEPEKKIFILFMPMGNLMCTGLFALYALVESEKNLVQFVKKKKSAQKKAKKLHQDGELIANLRQVQELCLLEQQDRMNLKSSEKIKLNEIVELLQQTSEKFIKYKAEEKFKHLEIQYTETFGNILEAMRLSLLVKTFLTEEIINKTRNVCEYMAESVGYAENSLMKKANLKMEIETQYVQTLKK